MELLLIIFAFVIIFLVCDNISLRGSVAEYKRQNEVMDQNFWCMCHHWLKLARHFHSSEVLKDVEQLAKKNYKKQ